MWPVLAVPFGPTPGRRQPSTRMRATRSKASRSHGGRLSCSSDLACLTVPRPRATSNVMSYVAAHEHLTGRGSARRWYLPQVLLLIADSRAGCKKMLCLLGSREARPESPQAGVGSPGCPRCPDWTTFSFVHQVSYRRERA